MAQHIRPQVTIIGAGPVGLTMAAELTRYGVTVRILEKAPARTDKSKALVVWSRTLELLNRTGCANAFVQVGLKAHSANIVAGGNLIGHVSLDGIATPYPYALMIPQSETERLLEMHLASLGTKVERQAEVINFEETADGVVTVVQSVDGTIGTVDSDWLIGCDGAHSMVRHKLGMAFVGTSLSADFILADVHLTGLAASESEICTFWHEEGVLVFFPISQGRVRIIADIGPASETARPDPTLRQVQEIVDRRGPGGLSVSDPVWIAGFRINERKVAHYRAGRTFLAGDAAHIHSPAGGQGMNTGMQDAFNLAWKLALVCRGSASPAVLLDSYSIERSAVGDKVLADADRLTKMAMVRNKSAQAIRNFIAHHVIGLPAVQRAMTNTLSELAVAYPNSPLTQQPKLKVDGLIPGARMAIETDENPVGSGNTPRFALFANDQAGFTAFANGHAEILETTLRPLQNGTRICLVRPDGYVAMTSAAGQWQEVDDYLYRITGRQAKKSGLAREG